MPSFVAFHKFRDICRLKHGKMGGRMLRIKWRDEMGFAFLVLALFFLLYISISGWALAQGDQAPSALWISKTADQSSYLQEDNITYTINYGNKGENSIDNVRIVDVLPKVEILYVSLAYSQDGNNLTWNIGTLNPHESGSITLVVKLPDRSYINFNEYSSVSGDGYVNIRKSISTIRENNSLNNTAIIYGDYTGSDLSLVTVKLVIKPVAKIKSTEHGSGHYNEEQSASLNTSIPTIKMKKDMSADYRPVLLSISGDKTLKMGSLWTDRTSALTEENGTVNSVTDEYYYMTNMKKETSFDLNRNEIAYSAIGNFSGGIANIEYFKKESGNKRNAAYISETYHGSFKVQQRLDSYGTIPTYVKSAQGFGFVSSDKVAGCGLRSYERGSGSYESAESIQADTILKNSTLIYVPNEQFAGSWNISYMNKWSEGMYARNPKIGSEILNQISYADYVQKDAIMSPSYLSFTGWFDGTDYLKAKKLNKTRGSEPIRLEQMLIGDYNFDTAISFGQALKYAYPHINLTKRVLSRDGNTFVYRIWVNNDGNKTIGPVAVVDLLPEGASFISSTLKPSVQGRIVSWTLQVLPVGETQIIDLKAWLADISPNVINRVQAAARYENRTIISIAASSPYDTIEEGNETTNESIELEEATSTGEWRPPACFILNSTMISCEKEIDAYYDNLSEEWYATGCA
jgi:uncharacterized repeat protein (TIGR01451 family)